MQWELYGTHGKHNGLVLQELVILLCKVIVFRDTLQELQPQQLVDKEELVLIQVVVAQIDRESQGDKLRSTALDTFYERENVNFVADGLKPNTRIYPFFDKVDVTRFCYSYW